MALRQRRRGKSGMEQEGKVNLRDEMAGLFSSKIGPTNSMVTADTILSLPSGLVAVKECPVCGGTGMRTSESMARYGDKPFDCECKSGRIERDMTVQEINDLVPMIIDGRAIVMPGRHGRIITLPSGERVEVKK